MNSLAMSISALVLGRTYEYICVGEFLGVELLGHRECMCQALGGTANQFYEVNVPCLLFSVKRKKFQLGSARA